MRPQDLLDRLAAGYEYDPMYGALCNERDQLKAENAKLRELLADAWGYINHPANATWTHAKRKEVRHSIGERMRELGTEVD